MKGRRNIILGLGASTLASVISLWNRSTLAKEKNFSSEIPLQDRAAAKGLFYGAFAQGHDKFLKDKQFQLSFLANCNLLTVGFYSKNICPDEHTFDLSIIDSIAKVALDNKIQIRGHPLIWHNLNPEWLIKKFKNPNTTSREIENILINHVSEVTKKYAGKVHSWDVINEAIMVPDGQIGGFRDTTKSGVKGDKYPTWFNFLGMDYIDLAFRVAAEADPSAMLTYNDYGLEYDIPRHEAKRVAVLNLLRRLKAKKTPLHVFGLQSHLQGHEKRFNPTKLRNFLRDIADLGLKIIISELDVADHKLPRDIEIRDRMVADAYYEYLSVVLDEPAVIGVITWGLSDRYTWLSSHKPRPDGAPVRPLPLGDDLNRKPAWYAIARAFDNAPLR